MEVVAESPYRFVIPRHGEMRVPGVVFATRALLPGPAGDRSLQQVANVAALPGSSRHRMRCRIFTWVRLPRGEPFGDAAARDDLRSATCPLLRPAGGVCATCIAALRPLVASSTGRGRGPWLPHSVKVPIDVVAHLIECVALIRHPAA
jgi:hypothetical protein